MRLQQIVAHLSDRLAPGPAEKPFGASAPEDDPAMKIAGEDRIAGKIEEFHRLPNSAVFALTRTSESFRVRSASSAWSRSRRGSSVSERRKRPFSLFPKVSSTFLLFAMNDPPYLEPRPK